MLLLAFLPDIADSGFWIIATAVLVNISCALLGTFLVLRRLSLVGDAISHSVLPGIGIAFLISGSRDPLIMMAGAAVAALVSVVLSRLIERFAGVPEDAALGVVFTTLFAIGVTIITLTADSVDLDADCVLHGILAIITLDAVDLGGGTLVPRVTVTLSVVALIVAGFVAVFWKELKLLAFDPGLARSLGGRYALIDSLFLGLVAVVTVAAFEAVGAILVIALLIVPAATGQLLTDRLWALMLLAVGFGIASAIGGRYVALAADTDVAGVIAGLLGVVFALAVVFAPRHGYLPKLAQRAGTARRMVREDLLAMLYRAREIRPDDPSLTRAELSEILGGGRLPRIAIRRLLAAGDIAPADPAGDRLTLAEPGLPQARRMVHKHRLWEAYLHRKLGVAPADVHPAADEAMHFIDDDDRQAITDEIDIVTPDPHGKPIPDYDAAP
jgi:manganese/zinc/iron transport system permease protein